MMMMVRCYDDGRGFYDDGWGYVSVMKMGLL